MGKTLNRLLLAACAAALAAPAMAEEVKRGGTAFIHMNTEQGVLNPALRASTGVYQITGKFMEPLIDRTYKGYEGVLATEWSSSPDGKAITFKLRDGVRWHDGKPFTCDDVAFSAMELWKPLLNYSSTLQANLESVDCPDPLTAVFNYSKPMPLELLVAAMPDLGHPVPKHLYEGTDILTNPHNSAPVGTGPFVFQEWKQTDYLKVKKFDGYWKAGLPKVDSLTWKPVVDNNTRATVMQTGEASFAFSMPFEQAEQLKQNPKIDVIAGPSIIARYLSMNTKQKPFDNVKVRHAINYAINKEALAKVAFSGYADRKSVV